MPSSRGSSQPKDQSHVSYISWTGGSFFTTSATLEASASASELTKNIQSWFLLKSIGLISLQPKGFSRIFSSTTQRHTLPSILYRMRWIVSSEPGDQVIWEILAITYIKSRPWSACIQIILCTLNPLYLAFRSEGQGKYVIQGCATSSSCQLMATWDLEMWAELP